MIASVISESIFLRFQNTLLKSAKLHQSADRILAFFTAVIRVIIMLALIVSMFIALPVRTNIKHSILTSKIGTILLQYSYLVESQIKTVFSQTIWETLNVLTIQPQSADIIQLAFLWLTLKCYMTL